MLAVSKLGHCTDNRTRPQAPIAQRATDPRSILAPTYCALAGKVGQEVRVADIFAVPRHEQFAYHHDGFFEGTSIRISACLGRRNESSGRRSMVGTYNSPGGTVFKNAVPWLVLTSPEGLELHTWGSIKRVFR